MFSNVVVIIKDWHQAAQAVAQAERLAARSKGQVTLLGVLSTQEHTGAVDPVLWNISRCELQAKLKHYEQLLQTSAIEAHIEIMDVMAVEKLFYALENIKADLIIVTDNKQQDGWITESLIKHAPVPVMLARQQEAKDGYKNILVPLDGSPRAESSLNLALALAKLYRARLHLGHVVQQLELPHRTQVSPSAETMAERLIQRNSDDAKRYLAQVAARLHSEVDTHLLVNQKPAASLHRLIDQAHIDLLVVCAHGYSGDAQWPLGTVADNLLRYGSIPTVVVQDLPAHIALSGPSHIRNASLSPLS